MHAERDLLGFCLRTRYRRVNVRAIESAKLQIGNAIFQHQSQWVANVLKVPELMLMGLTEIPQKEFQPITHQLL